MRFVRIDVQRDNPWENGTNASFNGVLRDGCLDRCLLLSLRDAREQIEAYRYEFNAIRPHGALNRRSPSQLFKDCEGVQTQQSRAR